MKNLFKIVLLFLFVISISTYAQEEPEPSPEKESELQNYVPAPPPPPLPMLDKKTESQYLKVLNSRTKAELKEIKEFNKQKYSELLADAFFNSNRFPAFQLSKYDKAMLERNKAISNLEISATAMSLKYKQAKDSEKSSIKKELNKVLFQLFDLKEESKKSEIKMLEKELDDLKKSISVREKNRDEIVERRMQDLIGESDYLEW